MFFQTCTCHKPNCAVCSSEMVARHDYKRSKSGVAEFTALPEDSISTSKSEKNDQKEDKEAGCATEDTKKV